MATALSEDLRSRVLKASSDGFSARQAAVRFGVGISTAIRWIGRARVGERAARPQGWCRGSTLDPHEAFIVAMIRSRRTSRSTRWCAVWMQRQISGLAAAH